MLPKAFVLVLAATLLGAGAPCSCLEPVPVAEKSCGHCPDETKPVDDVACCCVDSALDRSVEAAYSVSTPIVVLDADLPPAAAASLDADLAEAPEFLPSRGSPPLYLLHRHLRI